MGKLFIRHTTFEELESIPETVYKYRDWNNLCQRSIITDRQVWFAQPSTFLDPLDCKILTRYDLLTEKQIFEKYHYESKKMPEHSNWTRQQHRKFARDWAKKSPMKDKEYVKEVQADGLNKFDVRFGVLSLTADPKNADLWRLYSDDHSGFCVGFNSAIAFRPFGGAGEVLYYDELPTILPMPFQSQEEQHILQVFSKLNEWKHEKEYRAHKFYPNPATKEDRAIVLPSEAFKEIILGAHISDENKREIIDACHQSLPEVSILQASINENETINFTRI